MSKKPPSWHDIRAKAAVFSAKWADKVDENSGAQGFWRDFLGIFGVDVDEVGTYEARAERTSTGGRGRIDLLWPHVLVAEHKSAGKDLAVAEQQAIDYLDSLDSRIRPQYVLCSDFGHIRIRHLSGDNEPFTFDTVDLVTEVDRFGFIAGYQPRDLSKQDEEQASVQAARLMGRLYEELSASGYEGHEASVFLTRLLFLLFGDDTGMWERALFAEYVDTRTQADGSDLGPQLAMLFQVLDKPIERRAATTDELLKRFPYVNGGLFSDRLEIPLFDRGMREELIACCAFDWGSISPAIFGSLFQAVKSKEARRELGEHYTTEKNILRTIGPLFLDDLQTEFERVRDDEKGLKKLRGRIGSLQLFDPACGCGNFLVIAYRELRHLELEILKALRRITRDEQLSMDATLGLQVGLHQFYGIELEEWPARIAETAMFLVDHQANMELSQEFGRAPDRLPIDVTATIRLANAIRSDWREVLPPSDDVLILGNPPFIGMALMSEEQQKDRAEAFDLVYGADRTGRLDYVASWYAKAIHYMKGTRARAALVSTNSLTQGEQARTLGPLLANNGFKLDFAHRTFAWSSEAPGAAAVHVVIIGFSSEERKSRRQLFDYSDLKGEPVQSPASAINIYLANSSVSAIAKHAKPVVPGIPLMTKGSQPTDGGHLIVEADEYDAVMADPLAAKYVRRLIGARTGLHDELRWCLWLVDADPSDLAKSRVLRERLALVSAARTRSQTPSVRDKATTPSLFTQIRQPVESWLWVPRHSSENRRIIPMAFFSPDDIAHDSTLLIPGADEYLFGILQSSMFMAWVQAVSGRIKSDIRISPDLSYNSFPFPVDVAREKVEHAAQEVLDARAAFPRNSLADLYGAVSMPPELVKAHQHLDQAVDTLFGRRKLANTADRLQLLFERYNDLTAPLIPGRKPRIR